MADKTHLVFDRQTKKYYPVLLIDNGDGTYSEATSGSAVIGAGEAHIGEVGGKTNIVSVEFTRPANVNQYHANDIVGTDPATMLTFPNAGRIIGATGYITNVRLITNNPVVTNGSFRLYIYSQPLVPVVDHSLHTLMYANRANRLGFVDLNLYTSGTGSDSAGAQALNINLKFLCAIGRDLYGSLVSMSTYTPASAQQFFVELTCENN
jgi:hypothetical protein